MLNRFRRSRFSLKGRNSQNQEFYAELGDPGAYPRPRKEIQNLPHRALVTSLKALVSAGEVVTVQGVEYLLLEQHQMGRVKRFLAVNINDRLPWSRITETIHPVTQLPQGSAPAVVDPALPVVIEPLSSIEDVRFTQDRYRIFTAGDVKAGDLIDGMKVQEVQNLFGVKMAQLL